MSRRFGGSYSPNAQPDATADASLRPPAPGFVWRKPLRHGAKLNLLYVLALFPVLTAFFQPVAAIATDLVGMGALLL